MTIMDARLKIALSFPPDQLEYWRGRIEPCIAEKLPPASPGVEYVDFQSGLPQIIIGHESEVLTDYLRSCPDQLKWVQFMSAGLNKTLDALKGCPISFHITNMRGIHADAMAEYLLAAVLYFEKKLDYFNDSKIHHRWSRSSLGGIKGKRLLCCGAGAIGSRAAEVFLSLGSEVDAIARTSGSRPPFGSVFSLDELSSIVGRYDYVFCALPLTPETVGAFGRDVIGAMKRGAIFVNIARGEMVDENALADALCEGAMRGAALDVFSTEPLVPGARFWGIPNLIITPHVSGRFENGHELGLDILRRNMAAYLAGLPLTTEVFRERGY